MKTFHPLFDVDWKVFDGTSRCQAAEMTLAPGDTEGGEGNRHGGDQWLFVLEGRGEARVKGEKIALKPRTLLLIEAGETHQIVNVGTEPLRTLNFYSPPQYAADGEPLKSTQPAAR
ncbi:MAG: cupin domain-containing protein [Elusimicrobia bacterium]|nr:cupin domain-containing protein [Elusimicrobiota bacterium]